MKAFQDTDRVKNGIREAITLLCKSGLSFQSEMSIDGLLGITLDQNEVFLVSIQEVIKNSADYCVKPNITTQPEYHGQNMFDSLESCHTQLEDGAAHSSISKRSKRKRLLTKAYRPLVNLSPSRSSEIDTDDSTSVYYNDGVCHQKKHHPSYEPLHGQEDNDENNEPLSLVVRKSPCDSNVKNVTDCKLDVRRDDTSAYPTDLRVHQVDEEDGTPNNVHSQQNSIKQTPLADDFSDTRTQRSDQSDARPVLKPKTNSRKSKIKPKRILPLERNRPDDIDNHSLSSPSGSHSPPLATSQRSTPDDTEDDFITQPSRSGIKVENSDSVEGYCVNSDQTCEPNSTFTNVYESGIPVTSEALSSCKKDGLDVKDKLLDGIIHGAPDNPWGTIFDPDSHAKWLQSIAAYVQGPVKSAAFVPPLAHQCLPFVGGTLPNPKLSVPQPTKPQASNPTRLKESASISSKPSSSFVNTPIKVPVAVPKLVHSRSMHMCSNCGTQKTTTWRRGDDGTPLCNACGLYLKLHKPISSGSGQNSLRKIRHQLCSNCSTSVTTMWRRDSDGKPVCNACGLYFKLHKVNRPLTMVKSEIHSRRRKHKYGHFGGKLEPTSPGSVNTGNVSLPYPSSSNQQSSPGMLSQTMPLSYPESPGFCTRRESSEVNQRLTSGSNSPEPSQELEKLSPTSRDHPGNDLQNNSPRYAQACEYDLEDSADEETSESPLTDTRTVREQDSSAVLVTHPQALSSD